MKLRSLTRCVARGFAASGLLLTFALSVVGGVALHLGLAASQRMLQAEVSRMLGPRASIRGLSTRGAQIRIASLDAPVRGAFELVANEVTAHPDLRSAA